MRFASAVALLTCRSMRARVLGPRNCCGSSRNRTYAMDAQSCTCTLHTLAVTLGEFGNRTQIKAADSARPTMPFSWSISANTSPASTILQGDTMYLSLPFYLPCCMSPALFRFGEACTAVFTIPVHTSLLLWPASFRLQMPCQRKEGEQPTAGWPAPQPARTAGPRRPRYPAATASGTSASAAARCASSGCLPPASPGPHSPPARPVPM